MLHCCPISIVACAADAPVIANPQEAARLERLAEQQKAGPSSMGWTSVDQADIGRLQNGEADSPDLSPPRPSGRHDSPDVSPPRRRGRPDSPDLLPPRGPGGHSSPDASPPRRPGRHDSPDPSPPRLPGRHDSPGMRPARVRQSGSSSDASPPRRRQASPELSPPRQGVCPCSTPHSSASPGKGLCLLGPCAGLTTFYCIPSHFACHALVTQAIQS